MIFLPVQARKGVLVIGWVPIATEVELSSVQENW